MLFDLEYKKLTEMGIAGSKEATAVIIEQNSGDWFGIRCGLITASNAALIVTATGKRAKGKTRDGYIYGLVAEKLTRTIESGHSTLAMERGTMLEPQARNWYRFESGREVQEVGFVYTDAARQSGCSPDGLCADRGLEIKCPLRKNSVAFVLSMKKTGKVPIEHAAQVQFQMWVTGLTLVDFVVFNPENAIPSAMVTVEKDEKYHAMLDECIPEACAEIAEAVALLEEGAE